MKKAVLVGALSIIVGNAYAVCPGNAVPDAGFVLSGKRIDAAVGGDWKEIHCSSGDLKKVGTGTSTGVDPTTVIGSWSATESDVTYKYNKPDGSTNDFTFELHKQGEIYNFCVGADTKASGTLSDASDC